MTEGTHYHIADIRGTGGGNKEGGSARHLLSSPALPLMRVREAGRVLIPVTDTTHARQRFARVLLVHINGKTSAQRMMLL